MEIEYRTATALDVKDIKQLTDVMLEHTGLGLATEKKITNLVNSPRTLFMLATHENKLVGFILGVVHESLYNDKIRVSDLGLFVLPDYRSTNIGVKLIKHLESWAKSKNVTEVWLGQTTGDDPIKTSKLYERMGYTLRGFNSMKEI